jgi:hypothetical protein
VLRRLIERQTERERERERESERERERERDRRCGGRTCSSYVRLLPRASVVILGFRV